MGNNMLVFPILGNVPKLDNLFAGNSEIFHV